MKITYSQLRLLDACCTQLAEFKKRFGKDVDVTEELCASVASVFNWDWAARHFLPPLALAEYNRAKASARGEYDRATAPAWTEYERARAPALAEYERALVEHDRVTAGTEYEHAKAPAWADYKRATETARGEALRAMAGAFGRLLNEGVQP